MQYLFLTEACIALHDTEGFAALIRQALNSQTAPEKIQETVYQAIPYSGFSHVRPFMAILDKTFQNNAAALPLPSPKTSRQ